MPPRPPFVRLVARKTFSRCSAIRYVPFYAKLKLGLPQFAHMRHFKGRSQHPDSMYCLSAIAGA